jgi:hypothetical protein
MKNIIVLAMLAVFSMPIWAQDNANLKTETRHIGPYDKIKTSKGINVTLVEGDKEKVEIRIQNASPEDVITSLEGKTLVLKMKTLLKKGVAVQVYVTYKQINEIQAGTGSTVDNEGTLRANKLVLSAGAEAVMELDVDATVITASLSAGRIEISGEANNIEVNANTGGKFNASALQVNEAFIKTSAGGQATVRVKNRLSATAGSGGRVYYYGSPKVEKSESLGGKVEQAQ